MPIDSAWVDLGIGDELGKHFGWYGWVDYDDERRAHDKNDGSNVANKIEIELVKERRVDRGRRIEQK
jgi:hypothetical protein